MTTAIMGGGSEPKKQLGKILLQQKLVSAEALQDVRERETGNFPPVPRRDRALTHEALAALSDQHGVPAVDLCEAVIALSTLRLLPVELAREHALLPLRVDGEQLVMAMAAPQRHDVIEEIEFVAGKKVLPHVAVDRTLRAVLEYAYAQLEQGDEYYVGSAVEDAQLRTLGLPEQLPRAPETLIGAEPEAGAASDELSTPVRTQAPLSDSSGLAAALDTAFAERVMPSQPPRMIVPAADARVLIAHCDASLRAALRGSLCDGGVIVDEAQDGMQALELIRSQHPSVLVLDAILPLVQGLDICRRLRASARYAELPIVIVADGWAGWRVASDLRDGYGIKHFFERPYDLVRLQRTVRLLLDGQEVPEEPPPLATEAEARWNAGMKAFQEGDLDTAIVELEAGGGIDPQAFELQYHLGLLYGRRSDLFAAIAALQQAVRLQPRHFAAVKNLAVVYQRAGLRACALDAWERALCLAPDDATRATIKEHMTSLL